MAVPKLTLAKNDVIVAINRTFKSSIKNLTFTNNCSFSAADSISFSIQEEYIGPGSYSVEGQGNLWNETHTMSKLYHLSGRIKVTDNDGTPTITFPGLISVRK